MGFIINPYQVQPSGPSYGTLTSAWITATGETDLTILGALNTLESDLSAYGLTSKMKYLYPFVGGTSTKHSYNFMNTAAYQLTFSGGWTHSSTGALPNGTNAYANTGFNPSTQLSATSGNIGVYLRTNNSGNTLDFGVSAGGIRMYLCTDFNGTTGFAGFASEFSYTSTATTGLYSLGRLSSVDSNVKLIRNGTTNLYNANPGLGSLPNANNYLGASNENGTATYFSSRQLALAYASSGLTNSEISNFYTAVQTFQTTLSRNV
jgi:hypothetical protein